MWILLKTCAGTYADQRRCNHGSLLLTQKALVSLLMLPRELPVLSNKTGESCIMELLKFRFFLRKAL